MQALREHLRLVAMSSDGKGLDHARGQELLWHWPNVNLLPLFRVKVKRSRFRDYYVYFHLLYELYSTK